MAAALPAELEFDLGAARVRLRLRRSLRARRIGLRIDPAGAGAELVLPRGVGLDQGLRFAERMRRWLARRLAALPPAVPFADGARFDVAGEALTLRHRPEARGPVRREGGELIVGGAAEHAPRRVRDWLKAEARRVLAARSAALAARVGRRVASLRLTDPTGRWGSCSPEGGLAYSWRLILAPPSVLEYVVAHEVAHLIHLNHGARFWRLVAELAGDVDTPRAWLRVHGTALLRVGEAPAAGP